MDHSGGSLSQIPSPKAAICFEIQRAILVFRELAECSVSRPFFGEELECEEHLNSYYKRNLDGRSIVSIPLKISDDKLYEFKSIAEKRSYIFWRKFGRNPFIEGGYSAEKLRLE